VDPPAVGFVLSAVIFIKYIAYLKERIETCILYSLLVVMVL
jgi:hypothetical protein